MKISSLGFDYSMNVASVSPFEVTSNVANIHVDPNNTDKHSLQR